MKIFIKPTGFTLLEVLIALVILAISLLALAGLMSITTRNNAFSGTITEAATLAQDLMESLRVTNWDNIVNGNDVVQVRGVNYNRRWVVVLGPNSPAPPFDNEKRVSVTVNWNDGLDRSINFLTVITK